MQAARHLSYRVKLRPRALAVLSLSLALSMTGWLAQNALAAPGLIPVLYRNQADLIDINRATISQLKTLPGIQDSWAAAIVKNRPYKSKTQLLTRKILPFTAYRAIQDKIIAKQ